MKYLGQHISYRFSRAKLLLATLFLFGSNPLGALTLETVVSTYAVRVGDSASASMWSTLAEQPDIKWLDKSLRNEGRGRFVRFGHIELHRHGTATIFLSGTQDYISEIDVSIGEQEGKIFGVDQFTNVLRAQFGKRTKIKLLQTCHFSEISGLATYRVTLTGRKPVYIAAMADSGGSAPNSRSSTFQIAHRNEPRWRCDL